MKTLSISIAAEEGELPLKSSIFHQLLTPALASRAAANLPKSQPLQQETIQEIPRQQAQQGNKSSRRQHLNLNKYQFLKYQTSYIQ